MANLYDKAGLVNIPVGYQDGFLYNIKPEDNTLGFRFNRDSAATRVNKEGLIEQVGYFGPELVQNGDFSHQGSELMPSVGVIENLAGGTITQISGNSYSSTSDGTSSSTLRPKFDFNTTSGKTYKLVITPIGTITGTVNFDFYDGTTYLFQNYDFTTTKEIYFTDNGSVFGAFDGTQTYSITNFTISVKQVDPNDYWDLVSLEFTGDNTFKNTGFNGRVYQSFATTVGSKYKVSATVNSGTWNIVASTNTNTSGTIQSTGNTTVSEFFEFTATGTVSYLVLYNIGVSGSVGSITNASVVEVQGDKPRIDYTDSLTSPSFLLEPQSTNLLPYSENFSQWDLTRAISTANASISPDGTNNAYKLQSNTTGANGSWYRQVISAFNGGHNLSVYAKKNTADFLQLRIGGIGGVIFNLDTGVVKSQSSAVGSIEDVGNGWYRCSAQMTSSSSTTILLIVGNENMTPQNWYTTIGDSVYLWGAQLEALPYATSYIPTAGSTVTRAQETCVNAGNVSTFNSAEGVLYAEMAALADDGTFRYVTINDGTDQNVVAIRFSDTSNQILAFTRISGSFNAVLSTTSYSTVNFNKIAYRYKSGDFSLFINGTKINSSTSTQILPANTINTLSFNNATSSQMYGKIKSVYAFNEALTDDELQQLTGPEYNSFAALAAAYNYTVI